MQTRRVEDIGAANKGSMMSFALLELGAMLIN
jgi:hypothetical protein